MVLTKKNIKIQKKQLIILFTLFRQIELSIARGHSEQIEEIFDFLFSDSRIQTTFNYCLTLIGEDNIELNNIPENYSNLTKLKNLIFFSTYLEYKHLQSICFLLQKLIELNDNRESIDSEYLIDLRLVIVRMAYLVLEPKLKGKELEIANKIEHFMQNDFLQIKTWEEFLNEVSS